MKKLVLIALTLTIIAALAGISIGYANSKTEALIEAQRKASQTSSLTALFPEGTEILTDSIQFEGAVTPYWIGKRQDTLVGYAVKTGKSGYSGIISCLLSVDTASHILGISILSQTETPGLGSRVTEVISKERFPFGLFKKKEKGSPWFQDQYKGLAIVSPIRVSKKSEWHKLTGEQQKALLKANSVTAITGATISTVAVSKSLEEVAPLLDAIKKKHTPKAEPLPLPVPALPMEVTNDTLNN